jgi:hypothetical protein
VIRVVLQDEDSQEVAYDLRADKDKTMVRKWVKVSLSLLRGYYITCARGSGRSSDLLN